MIGLTIGALARPQRILEGHDFDGLGVARPLVDKDADRYHGGTHALAEVSGLEYVGADVGLQVGELLGCQSVHHHKKRTTVRLDTQVPTR